jgi:uncharacterized membrane protein
MKNYILTGLILLLPVILTFMIIVFLFDLFTEPFFNLVSPLIHLIPYNLPDGFALFLSRLLSLVLLCLFILFLGMITQLFLIKSILNWLNRIVFRIPFIKTVYKTTKDVFSALFSTDEKKAFKRPVMIPFPTKPSYCLGFEAGEVARECQQKVKEPLTAVFAPTAPHPISGFLFLVPTKDIHQVDMTNEDALKFLVSCGMILPEGKRNDG